MVYPAQGQPVFLLSKVGEEGWFCSSACFPEASPNTRDKGEDRVTAFTKGHGHLIRQRSKLRVVSEVSLCCFWNSV